MSITDDHNLNAPGQALTDFIRKERSVVVVSYIVSASIYDFLLP